MYNTNPVTLREAKKLAIAYMKAGIIPLLVSAPGIGKTTMVSDIAEELNAELRHLRLNSIPPEEAVGLQFLNHDTKRTVRFAPSWLPAEDGSDGPVVVFLDELMQAPDEYRKGIMSALLERYLGQHRIPSNCMFIAAGNSVEDGSNVHELDRATADRFGIIMIRTDVEAWLNDYAATKNIHPAVVGYLRHMPTHFEMTGPDQIENPDIVIKPSPRSWESLSNFLKVADSEDLEEPVIKAGINGKIGSSIGSSLWVLVGKLRNHPTLTEMLKMDPMDQAEATPDSIEVLWAYSQAMLVHANTPERIYEILCLLNNFKRNGDIPLVECRTTVVETMLKRARHVHEISIASEPRIAEMLRHWEHEKKAMAQVKTAVKAEEGENQNEAKADDKADDMEMKRAA